MAARGSGLFFNGIFGFPKPQNTKKLKYASTPLGILKDVDCMPFVALSRRVCVWLYVGTRTLVLLHMQNAGDSETWQSADLCHPHFIPKGSPKQDWFNNKQVDLIGSMRPLKEGCTYGNKPEAQNFVWVRARISLQRP